MGVKVIVTGATGMVGEGVLHECLQHRDIERVLIINRRPSGVTHPKLQEIVLANFFDLSSVASELVGYDACFFCMGVSSIRMKEGKYYHLTFSLTLHFARTLLEINPDSIFCYVSGSGTDSSEVGRSMWARIKGKTENHLILLGFRDAYMFRPGLLFPTPGLKNALKSYRYINWLFPTLRRFFPKYVCTLQELGLAMINSTTKGFEKSVLEVTDIIEMASVSTSESAPK